VVLCLSVSTFSDDWFCSQESILRTAIMPSSISTNLFITDR
jgi:hypothetical protein